MIHDGTFEKGVHYFYGPWGRRPIFSWKAIVRFIEGPDTREIEDDDETARAARKLLEDG